jgi:hypothetical protein
MTLDEWFENWPATRLLRENLEINLDTMAGKELNDEERETLMRMNLVVVRQCLEDFGVSP